MGRSVRSWNMITSEAGLGTPPTVLLEACRSTPTRIVSNSCRCCGCALPAFQILLGSHPPHTSGANICQTPSCTFDPHTAAPHGYFGQAHEPPSHLGPLRCRTPPRLRHPLEF